MATWAGVVRASPSLELFFTDPKTWPKIGKIFSRGAQKWRAGGSYVPHYNWVLPSLSSEASLGYLGSLDASRDRLRLWKPLGVGGPQQISNVYT